MSSPLTTEAFRVQFPSCDSDDTSVSEITLAGIVDRPRSESGSASVPRPTVIFSHCFTCNKDLKATVRLSRALARKGINVLRFDMRGLGNSKGDFSQSNFTSNLHDLAAAIRFADSEIGPVTGLIGHSFGGIASLVTAARHFSPSESSDLESANVDRLIPLQHLGAVVTLAAPSDTVHLADLLARMNPAIESEGIGEVSIGGVSWTIRRQMLEDFRSHDVPRWLPRIECPVMLMHSPVDETVGYDHALRIMGLITGGNSPPPVTLLTLGGADHLLVNDPRDLEYVPHQIAGFMNRYAMPS